MDYNILEQTFKLFTADEWSEFGLSTNLNLNEAEIKKLRSLCDPIDINEVKRIYLPLIKFLNLQIKNFQTAYLQRQKFFKKTATNYPPFIVGIAGSVAVGKSTMARILQILLKRSVQARIVDLVTTDGFLYSNSILTEKKKMHRKGFPDSYNIIELLKFLSDVKNLKNDIQVPLYSHSHYDVIENERQIVNCPEVLIVEGVNVLQVYRLKKENQTLPFVSDFFDFSIYIDAQINNIEKWYIDRFMKLRKTSFIKKDAYFKKYTILTDEQALEKAKILWKNINLKNLNENIIPSKRRANLIFYKGNNHLVKNVKLRT